MLTTTVPYLLLAKYEVVELLLQHLVRVVDQELLVVVLREHLEPKNVQQSDEGPLRVELRAVSQHNAPPSPRHPSSSDPLHPDTVRRSSRAAASSAAVSAIAVNRLVRVRDDPGEHGRVQSLRHGVPGVHRLLEGQEDRHVRVARRHLPRREAVHQGVGRHAQQASRGGRRTLGACREARLLLIVPGTGDLLELEVAQGEDGRHAAQTVVPRGGVETHGGERLTRE